MAPSDDRLREALDRIDQANSLDPNTVLVAGAPMPAELLYSRRMTEWLARLYPQAGEALQLAARAQHIRRWEIPRNRFPMDRIGYLKWRTTLYTFHADAAESILRQVGYDNATIARVRSLLKKERIKSDADAQALEDVICLCFLENYFADFAPRHEEEKVIGILRKTWAKMSPVGHAAALKLPMAEHASHLVKKALAG